MRRPTPAQLHIRKFIHFTADTGKTYCFLLSYVLAASGGSSAASFAPSSLPPSAVPSLSSGFFRKGSTCVPHNEACHISQA